MPGRRGTSLTAATVEFELESFEQVAGGAGLALLRLCGRWRSDAAAELGPPSLVVQDGRRRRRVEAVRDSDGGSPEADPEGCPWSAAFSVPERLLARGPVEFALVAGDVTVELPAPSVEPGGDGAPSPAEVAAERDELALHLREALQARAELQRQLEAERQAREELAERLDEAVEAGVELERGLASEREARGVAQARVAELEDRLAEAEAGPAPVEPPVAEPAPAAAPAQRPWLAPEARRRRAVALEQARLAPSSRRRPASGARPDQNEPMPPDWLVALVLMSVGFLVVVLILTEAIFKVL
jgi:hypothetical protein